MNILTQTQLLIYLDFLQMNGNETAPYFMMRCTPVLMRYTFSFILSLALDNIFVPILKGLKCLKEINVVSTVCYWLSFLFSLFILP